MPKSREELQLLLNVFLLEKAVYELGYELNNRPDWVDVPIAGVLELFQPHESR
jgi:maltose alpha-D-glucosyltransferase/alpha-amylase